MQRTREAPYLVAGDVIKTVDGDDAVVRSVTRQGVQTVVTFRMANGRYQGEYAQQTIGLGARCILK